MSAINTSPWKIKLLSGSYAGHEIMLNTGTVRLGTNDSCDFIIGDLVSTEADASLSESMEFELDVQDEGITLSSIASHLLEKVTVSDRQVQKEQILHGLLLPPNKCISIQNYQFIIGRPSETLDISLIKEENRIPEKRSRKGTLFFAFIFLAAILGVIAVAILTSITETDAPTQVALTTDDIVKKLLLADKLGDVKASWSSNGSLELIGYSQSATAYHYFLDQLNQLNIEYKSHVVNGDDLVNNITFLLNNQGYKDIKVVSSEKPGYVVIQGVIEGDEKWEKVSSLLINDVAGLKGWSVKGKQMRFSYTLLKLLQESDLSSLLAVVDYGERIIITGELSEEKQQLLDEKLAEAKRDQS